MTGFRRNFELKSEHYLGVLLLISFSAIQFSQSVIVDKNPYHHREVIDTKGKYTLEWLVDKPSGIIIFNVTVKTTGYVGFGLNREGVMKGADMVIGGVDAKGNPYFKDMHGTKNRTVKPDAKQDWKLLASWEYAGYTSLKFSRVFDTCDEDDYAITDDYLAVLWAYGERDDIGNHYHNRGWLGAYLLDPEKSPDIDELVSQKRQPIRPTEDGPAISWKLRRTLNIPAQRTSYWCSIHQAPRLPHKHHIIGFRTFLQNELARRHTHHLIVYRCQAPNGIDPQVLFEPFTQYPGEECYLNENRRLPIQLCRSMLSVWGFGGKPFFLPETVGFPIGESQNEYLLYEVHYDNPDERSDLVIENGVEYFMTPKTRPRDGGIMTVGFDIPGALAAIPPGSPNFRMVGHCNSNCTRAFANSPGVEEGIDVVAVGLHAHYATQRIRLEQYRKDTELPWLMKDDNYNPSFQQIRLLDKERKIFAEDQLMSRCHYDNTIYNGTTTITGFGTNDEMCLAFVVIANRIPFYRCTSEYPAQRLLQFFGVEGVMWDVQRQQRIVTAPSHLQGLTLSQVGDYHIKWTEALRERLENEQLYSPHAVSCPSSAPPPLPVFLASFALQAGSSVIGQVGGQQLRQSVTQGVSRILELGISGIQQSLGGGLQSVLASLSGGGGGGGAGGGLLSALGGGGGGLQSILSSLGGAGGGLQSVITALGGGGGGGEEGPQAASSGSGQQQGASGQQQQSSGSGTQQQSSGSGQQQSSSGTGGQQATGGGSGQSQSSGGILPPIFPQGTPPTGFSGLGLPPNSPYPLTAAEYRPEPTCRKYSDKDQLLKIIAPKIEPFKNPFSPILNNIGLKRAYLRAL